MSDITITLHDPSSGRSESMPVPNTLTIQEVLDLGKALLDLEDGGGSSNSNNKIAVTKYGKVLAPPTQSLAEAGVINGDLLAFLRMRPKAATTTAPSPSAAATTTTGGGGLDFSSLLLGGGSSASGQTSTSAAARAPQTSSGGGGGLDFSSLLTATSANPKPVYYPGMSFEEAYESNPHPKVIVELLQKHSHLFKEFNYHMVRTRTRTFVRSELYRNTPEIARFAFRGKVLCNSAELNRARNTMRTKAID